MKFNVENNYFDYVKEHPEYKVIIYGAGNVARKYYRYFGHIDFFCDKNAKNIGSIDHIPCVTIDELTDFNGKLIVLVCIQNRKIADEVCQSFENLGMHAELFYFYENVAFSRFDFSKYRYIPALKDKLKIRIVYSDDGWVFGKFANKLQDELTKMGHEVEVGDTEDITADVNHYISYGRLSQFCNTANTVKTTMITHIDCQMKRDLIAFQAQHGAVGICMSAETMNMLASWGIPRDKLCYINPAQDGVIRPRKIVLGITNRCHGEYDFRKRDDLILKVCQNLDPQFFRLKIMGNGWDEIVQEIQTLGFEIEYYNEFDKETYIQLMQSLDYWLYYGFDEGAMGFLDALAAGVKTIATPQGYHLDTKCGLTHPCKTIDDFINTLMRIQNEKKSIINAVKDWTWENYATKHLEIWNYLTGTAELKRLYEHQSEYLDGIYSLYISDNRKL